MRLVDDLHPDEIYNLAAQSHVRASFDQPVHTGDVTGLSMLYRFKTFGDDSS